MFEENDKKICFVICYNNERYLYECMLYIDSLNIPEGYCIENISIKGAQSITAGYQQAMTSTDAKFIVYLHQDVFILEKDFLKKTIDLFNADKFIGMIGMVGTKKLPENAIMWQNKERVGLLRSSIIETVDDYFDKPMQKPYTEVDAVDGLLMMTNRHDVDWRTDLFDGWDFYDVSQSTEYRKKGYKVVVPYQKKPWVLHDCGFLNMADYEKYRRIYVHEYIEKKRK